MVIEKAKHYIHWHMVALVVHLLKFLARRALAEELSTRQERIDVPHLHHFPAATDKFSIGVELGYNRSVDWRQQAFAKFPGSSNDLPEWTNAPGPGSMLSFFSESWPFPNMLQEVAASYRLCTVTCCPCGT